ncbi:hypothetical protein AVEN_156998-1 [Araneus ventricosus]|uniref:Uncharacterized protein n=1 Tax=Araneus ventricosus TaxID=182803 RepID=A0A4Y2TGZ9_ARAVE|nr:hypothetical protein AVEN_156998-1 [Araneus ventricosus]
MELVARQNAVMSKKKSTAPIVQSTEDFANVVKKAMPSTTVVLFLDKDINRNDNNTINISTENWVVVKYNESLYAGEVTQVLGNDIEVSAMENFGNGLNEKIKVFYNTSEAIKVIQPPTVINDQGVSDLKDF